MAARQINAGNLTLAAQRFIADDDYVAVEFRGHSTTKTGMPYNNTSRPARSATNQIRAGRQSEDGEGIRADYPAIDPRQRRRGHRVMRLTQLGRPIAGKRMAAYHPNRTLAQGTKSADQISAP
jgi:hypothetical protein